MYNKSDGGTEDVSHAGSMRSRYMFDVGVTALAHSDAPVREAGLSYIRSAITGEIDAVVPYASVLGAHNALTTYYGFSNERASRLMRNFLQAQQIDWTAGLSKQRLDTALEAAADSNVDGWDAYYATVALEQNVEAVLTLDDDFERFSGVDTEVILSADQFATLNDYLGY